MGYVYRNCGVEPGDHLHLGAVRGRIADPEAIRARMDEVQHASRDGAADPREDRRLDLQEPARPQGLEADRCRRLRGLRVGGAQVSEMHCNFLINTGERIAARH